MASKMVMRLRFEQTRCRLIPTTPSYVRRVLRGCMHVYAGDCARESICKQYVHMSAKLLLWYVCVCVRDSLHTALSNAAFATGKKKSWKYIFGYGDCDCYDYDYYLSHGTS